MSSLQDALEKHSKKAKYVQMMNGRIRAAQEDFDIHMKRLESAKAHADILFDLLAYGVLIIKSPVERAL